MAAALRLCLVGLLGTACAALACDRGVEVVPHASAPVHVVGVSVGPEQPLYVGDSIVIAFDRYLDPRTPTRQSFAVVDAFGALTANPVVVYDPETRTVTLSSASGDDWLPVDQPYTLVLGIPAAGQFLGGVRGLDGGTLGPDQTQLVPFFVRARTGAAPAPIVPVSFCEEIQPVLQKACARCHDGSTSGLDLRSAGGLQNTAVGQLAHAESAGATTTPTPATAAFAQGAALIDPPNAGASYLLSTVLARAIGTEPSRAYCTSLARVAPVPAVTLLADPGNAERDLLASLLGGGAMPPADAPEAPLSLDERRVLSQWIREGAALASCTSACAP